MLACYMSFLSQLMEQWASNATAQLLNVAIMEVLLSPWYFDSSPAYLSWRMAGCLNVRSINFFQITKVASVLHPYLHITEWQETVHALWGGSKSFESRLFHYFRARQRRPPLLPVLLSPQKWVLEESWACPNWQPCMTSTLVYLNIKQCFHIDRIHNEKCMNNHEPNLLAVNQAITHGGHAYKLHIYTLPHTPHVHTTWCQSDY